MTNPPIARFAKHYADIMEEIKLRLAAIETFRTNPIVHPYVMIELCFLQYRYICELLALGCLVAHGDTQFAHSRKLLKQWSADSIIKHLERLHPDFYPRPYRLRDPSDASTEEPIADGYLSKEKLLSLYARCNLLLHRGTLNGILREEVARHDSDEVDEWGKEIVSLLNYHKIALKNQRYSQLIVLMKATDDRAIVFATPRNNNDAIGVVLSDMI
jgi:hypothetical protein